MTLPEAFVIHRSPQRLRIMIPALRRRAELLRPPVEQLKSDPDVADATANPLTGCVVILGAAGPDPDVALQRSQVVDIAQV